MKETDQELGLYPKYYVARLDKYGIGSPVQDWVFVLNPVKDKGARFALRAYAVWARANGYENLAADLFEKLKEYQ